MAGPDALAQSKVKLSNGQECSYSSITISPNGTITVTCDGTPPPPPPPVDPTIPGTFVTASATMNAAVSSVAQVTVNRTLGSLGTALYYWLNGPGCVYDGGAGLINFASGQMSTTVGVSVNANTGATCAFNLAAPPAPGVLGSPSATTITLTTGGGGNVPGNTPAGCPAGYVVPEDMLTASLSGMGNPILQRNKSAQVVSIPLPNLNGLTTGSVIFGESPTAGTPQPVTLEISINKCPGLINTDYSNSCNIRSTMSSYNSVQWLTKPYSIINDTNSSLYGLCWAGDNGSQYYVNARWTYSLCGYGLQTCGFAIQYNQGPY